ncbi:MAG: glycosyltransferase, partial [Gluconacetobacter diazotrophicus]|nr:glycosyltransferase [Gluconacetobacter diazotrophicus]
RFPFGGVVVVPRGRWRWLHRIIERQILRRPLLLDGGETRRLLAEIEDRRCALLHIFFGNVGVRLLPLLRHPARRFPVIVSFHGADVLVELDRKPYRDAVREVFDRTRLVLARSQSLVGALVQLGCPPQKIRLNRTGIPLGEFPYVRRTDPAGKFRLLQACRLIEKKGLTTTLRAFAAFARVYPEADLTLAGEGPLEPSLRQLAAELGVAGRVGFPGFLSQHELRRRLYASHLFLHPSETGRDGNQEGVPNSLLEAMATGLPVFATTHGGIPEAVEHGVSGWLVPEGDHVALAQAMIELTADPERLAAMGAAAAASVATNFDAAAQARNLEDCYAEALGRTSP